jgi:hypothetical protein
MTYASGGLIQASDFNNLAWGGTQGTYTSVTKNIAYVMGVGSGAWGYGQTITGLNTVAAAATVTAAQWSGLLTILNNALAHQGSTTLGSNYTTGGIITYFSNVNTAVTTINSNANNTVGYAANVVTTPASTTVTFTGTTSTAANTTTFTRTATFGSADQARYFFNAGGRIHWTITATNSGGSLRGADLVTLAQTNTAGGFIAANSSDGIVGGSGGTVNTDATSLGYYQLTTSDQSMSKVTSTNYRYEYNQSFFEVLVKSNGVQGSNGDKGTVITFTFSVSLQGAINSSMGGPFNDNVSVPITVAFTVRPPVTTYLTNTWGNVTIA